MTIYFELILFPIAIFIVILSIIKGQIWNKIISIILLLLLPIFSYIWFDSGLQLKSSEDFFVQEGYGKYSNYSEKEKQEKIIELEKIKDKERIIFNLSGYAYFLTLLILIIINFKAIKSL